VIRTFLNYFLERDMREMAEAGIPGIRETAEGGGERRGEVIA
jgi:hypothetical protein